jgi:hypothetical protein
MSRHGGNAAIGGRGRGVPDAAALEPGPEHERGPNKRDDGDENDWVHGSATRRSAAEARLHVRERLDGTLARGSHRHLDAARGE